MDRPRPHALRSLLAACVLPFLLLAPALLPGRTLLPTAPARLEPFATEDRARADALAVRENRFDAERSIGALVVEEIACRAIRAGELPSWANELGTGLPLAGGVLRGAFAPTKALAWILGSARARAWSALLLLVLAGLGMQRFLLRREHGAFAAMLGGAVLQSGAFAWTRVHALGFLETAAWLPWAWWAIERARASERRSGLLLALAIGCACLAGETALAASVLVATIAYAAFVAVEARRVALLATSIAWSALGVAIGAVELVPTFANARTTLVATAERPGPIPLASATTLVVPELFGTAQDPQSGADNPVARTLCIASERAIAEHADAREWNVTAGIAALVLAAAAFGVALGARSPPLAALFALGLAVATFLLARTELVARALASLPGSGFGPGAAALVAIGPALAWLAAIGLERLAGGERGARAATQVLATLVVAAASVLAFAPLAISDPSPAVRAAEARLHAAGLVAATLALAALVLATITRRLGARNAAIAWIALVAAQGWRLAREHATPRAVSPAELWPASPTIDAIAAATGDGSCALLADASGPPDVAPANVLAAYGVRELAPATPFQSHRVVELATRVDAPSVVGGGLRAFTHASLANHLALDLLRVRCVVAAGPVVQPGLELVHSAPRCFVYRRACALPIARVVDGELLRIPGSVGVLGLVAASSVDLARHAVADAYEPATAPSSTHGDPPACELVVHRPAADRIDVEVRADVAGGASRLAIEELWSPGWKAVVRGEDAEVARVDHVARAVTLPPLAADERVVVRLKHEPQELRAGAWITLGALATALAIAFASRARAQAPLDAP